MLAFDVEHAVPFEDDVDLVVVVRLLAVGLWGDEDVDADLETGGGVDDLVAAGFAQAFLHGFDVEGVRDLEHRAGEVLAGRIRHRSKLSPFRTPGGRSERSMWRSGRSHE